LPAQKTCHCLMMPPIPYATPRHCFRFWYPNGGCPELSGLGGLLCRCELEVEWFHRPQQIAWMVAEISRALREPHCVDLVDQCLERRVPWTTSAAPLGQVERRGNGFCLRQGLSGLPARGRSRSRSKSRVWGFSKRCSSRFSAANLALIWLPAGIMTPLSSTSFAVARMRLCTGDSRRSTSSIMPLRWRSGGGLQLLPSERMLDQERHTGRDRVGGGRRFKACRPEGFI